MSILNGTRRPGSHHRTLGMTLVETVVTMGIASAMMMTLIQMFSMAQRSAKVVTTDYEWQNMISTMRSLLTNDTACMNLFGGEDIVSFDPTAGAGATGGDLTLNPRPGGIVGPIQQLKAPGIASLLQLWNFGPPGTRYPYDQSFNVTSISVNQVAALTSLVTLAPGQTYTNYMVKLSIKADKKDFAGSTAPGNPNNQVLGSKTLTTETSPLYFFILVGPLETASNKVHKCFGQLTAVAVACTDLGGTPVLNNLPTVTPPQVRCQLPRLIMSGLGGPANAAPLPGEKLQLYSSDPTTYGLPSSDDISIGFDHNGGGGAPGLQDTVMWFNIRGSGLGGDPFLWHYYRRAQGFDPGYSQDLMKLDSNAILTVNGGQTAGGGYVNQTARFAFDAAGAAPRGFGAMTYLEGAGGDLNLNVANNRLTINKEGDLVMFNALFFETYQNPANPFIYYNPGVGFPPIGPAGAAPYPLTYGLAVGISDASGQHLTTGIDIYPSSVNDFDTKLYLNPPASPTMTIAGNIVNDASYLKTLHVQSQNTFGPTPFAPNLKGISPVFPAVSLSELTVTHNINTYKINGYVLPHCPIK